MSLANFGEREPKSTPRAGKKMLGGAVRATSPSEMTRAKGRDTLLEDELKNMAAGVKQRNEENFLHFGLERSEAKPGGKGRAVDRDMRSHIFEGPKPNAVPSMRFRGDLPEEELKKIHAGDADERKKQEVATNMAKADNMISKMMSANYPIPRKNEEAPRGKKGTANRQVVGSEVLPENAVEGFSGMGALCPPLNHRQGIGFNKKEATAPVVTNIPTAGQVTAPKHSYNTLTGVQQGVAVKGEYVTNTSASYTGY